MGMAPQVPLSIRWLVRPPAPHNIRSSPPHVQADIRCTPQDPTVCYRRLTNDVCISPFVLVQYSDRVTLGKDILVRILTVITRAAKGCTNRILLDGSFSRPDGPSCDEQGVCCRGLDS